MLDRVDEIEVYETQQGTRQNVAVECHKVEYTTLAHSEGVGILWGPVVAVVFHVVILERDKGGHKRNHGDDAEHPVHPGFRKQGVVGSIVHESDDTHPQVTESQVGRPLEQAGLGGPS